MKKILTLALALTLTTPSFAQRMGSLNRNAPTVKQSVEAGQAKISLNYTSINWGDGRTMKMVSDKENGARARQMVNGSAAENPIAQFSSSVNVDCGELHIPAGDYKVYFTVDDDCVWHINFHAKDAEKALSMKLDLMPSDHQSKNLLMCLYAEDDGAGVYLSFGTHSGMLSIKPAAKKDK